jgi:hypothetical protein
MILPKKRDPRFITVRRGGTLQDSDHHMLAVWAADCAQHVMHLFEEMQPNDDRPRRAIELARAWTRGEFKQQTEQKKTTYHIREQRFGSFERTVMLPTDVQSDKAKADFENGVLTVTLPKAETVKPRTISIKAK